MNSFFDDVFTRKYYKTVISGENIFYLLLVLFFGLTFGLVLCHFLVKTLKITLTLFLKNIDILH